MKWIEGLLAALALVTVALVILMPRRTPQLTPADARLTLRTEAYHYCERRLVASLPKETDLNVRAFRRGHRSSTEISRNLFRVVGFFDGRVFGAESHGKYECLVRHAGGNSYELIQLRMHREPPYPHR